MTEPASTFPIVDPAPAVGPPGDIDTGADVDSVIIHDYDAVPAAAVALARRGSHQTDVLGLDSTIGTPLPTTLPDHSQPGRNQDAG